MSSSIHSMWLTLILHLLEATVARGSDGGTSHSAPADSEIWKEVSSSQQLPASLQYSRLQLNCRRVREVVRYKYKSTYM